MIFLFFEHEKEGKDKKLTLLLFKKQIIAKNKISRPLYLLRYGVNLSILLTPGKEIKRDSASSGERRRNRSKEKGMFELSSIPMHLLSKRLVGIEDLRISMEIGANEGESPVAES